MKKIVLLTAAVSLMIVGSIAAGEKTETAKETKVLKAQTNCPVMGGKIDSSAYTDIQGQRVYHCCPMCTASLKKDPDKYFKKAAEEGIVFENIQTTCPVSGHELTTEKKMLDFEGRRLYFCSDNCIAEFSKDAQKFLKAMDAAPEMKKEATEAHEGHSH